MSGVLLLILIASVATPILLTFLYRKTLSPTSNHNSLTTLPTAYKTLLVFCAAIPVIGSVSMDVIEKVVDIDTWWPLLFSGTIIMCIIVTDSIFMLARNKRWLSILALPYMVISALCVALSIYMLIMTFDKHPRYF